MTAYRRPTCRIGLSLGPLGWVALVAFVAIMLVGALYYAALIGLIVGAWLLGVAGLRWLERTREDQP